LCDIFLVGLAFDVSLLSKIQNKHTADLTSTLWCPTMHVSDAMWY